eukprot:scaffold141116_cov386-Phaeocystis_antarctica.AAC.1
MVSPGALGVRPGCAALSVARPLRPLAGGGGQPAVADAGRASRGDASDRPNGQLAATRGVFQHCCQTSAEPAMPRCPRSTPRP